MRIAKKALKRKANKPEKRRERIGVNYDKPRKTKELMSKVLRREC